MQLIFKKRVWLISGFVCLMLSTLVYFYINQKERSNNHFYRKVEIIKNQLQNQLNIIERDKDFIISTQKFKTKKGIASYNAYTQASYFILEENDLYFWSDNKYNLPVRLINDAYKYKFYSNRQGQFLSIKYGYSLYDKHYDLIFIQPLFYQYQIENKYLKSDLNPVIFGKNDLIISSIPSNTTNDVYIQGQFLFSLHPPITPVFNVDMQASFIFFMFLTSVSFIILFLLQLRTLESQQKIGESIIFLIVVLALTRILFFIIDFSSLNIKHDVFDPKFYASSIFTPSFADLILNVFFILIITIYLYHVSYRWNIIRLYIIRIRAKSKQLTIILTTTSFLICLAFYGIFYDLYFNSQFNYDVIDSIEFTTLEYCYLFVFAASSAIYFLLNRMLINTLVRITSSKQYSLRIIAVVSVSFILIACIILGYEVGVVLLIHMLYIFVIYYLGFTENLYSFKYETYLYLIITGIVCSLIAAFTLSQYNYIKTRNQKIRLAENVLLHNDLQGEYLMSELANQIGKDWFIKDIISKPLSSKDLITQKIRKIYLGNYFDKYDVKIYLFDAYGYPLNDNDFNASYDEIFTHYNKPAFSTEYKNLFYINSFDEDYYTRYMSFIPLYRRNAKVGHILIEFNLVRVNPNSVYPRLLHSNTYEHDYYKKFQYAVFQNEKLIFSTGTYNYDADVYIRAFKSDKAIAIVSTKGYDHIIYTSSAGRKVVVSSLRNDVYAIFTNFSFLFTISVLVVFGIILFVTLFSKGNKRRVRFVTRLHIYSNIGFIMPLLLVSFSVVSLVSSRYEMDLKNTFTKKSENIGMNLINYIEDYNEGRLKYTDFVSAVNRLSRYAEADINLYDNEGQLLLSSQPLIFEVGLLSSNLNPEAYKGIISERHKQVLIEETIGAFQYNAVYMGLFSPQDNDLLGTVSVPFFNSRYDLNAKKSEILTLILNVFTIVFVLILILSYVSFKQLTEPLKMIALQLKKTTLTGDNEKINWQSGDDEIGVLVNEYNEMIEKLAQSKVALARSEKETAWKEMAQQVAHEIKNPLTPMKLKIQHLIRTQSTGENDKLKKSLEAMLETVDTLNEIATSFSSFAKMPAPIFERFDLINTLNNVIRIYDHEVDLVLTTDIQSESLYINGDENMIGRIFTNLILNGIQSVSNKKKPHIHIQQYLQDDKVLISIKDNGTGIPDEIAHKVFLPNFSTKYTGSGIGLALAKKGIEHAGGAIWFETSSDNGTCFYVQLPVIE